MFVKAPMHINSHTKFQLGFSKFQIVRTAAEICEFVYYANMA